MGTPQLIAKRTGRPDQSSLDGEGGFGWPRRRSGRVASEMASGAAEMLYSITAF
jgi:hypothetical protein